MLLIRAAQQFVPCRTGHPKKPNPARYGAGGQNYSTRRFAPTQRRRGSRRPAPLCGGPVRSPPAGHAHATIRRPRCSDPIPIRVSASPHVPARPRTPRPRPTEPKPLEHPITLRLPFLKMWEFFDSSGAHREAVLGYV